MRFKEGVDYRKLSRKERGGKPYKYVISEWYKKESEAKKKMSKECKTCGGSGYKFRPRAFFAGKQIRETCPDCKGTGQEPCKCSNPDCKNGMIIKTGCCGMVSKRVPCPACTGQEPDDAAEFNIEKLSELVHKAYCKQYKKVNGKEYWTRGDYSCLDEQTKEYDRVIVRAILGEFFAIIVQLQEDNDSLKAEKDSLKAGKGRADRALQSQVDLAGQLQKQMEAERWIPVGERLPEVKDITELGKDDVAEFPKNRFTYCKVHKTLHLSTEPKCVYCAIEQIAQLQDDKKELQERCDGPKDKFIKAVKDEPELPGDMPDEMWDAIKNDKDAIAKALQITVKQTKENIIERFRQALTEQAKEKDNEPK